MVIQMRFFQHRFTQLSDITFQVIDQLLGYSFQILQVRGVSSEMEHAFQEEQLQLTFQATS